MTFLVTISKNVSQQKFEKFLVSFVAVKKKLQTIAKVKECEEVAGWIRSISDHLYWSAASTQGNNGDLILSKWKSVANHVQNVHEGHEGPFQQCKHEELEARKWLKPGI